MLASQLNVQSRPRKLLTIRNVRHPETRIASAPHTVKTRRLVSNALPPICMRETRRLLESRRRQRGLRKIGALRVSASTSATSARMLSSKSRPSRTRTAFNSTNWATDQGTNALNCDGKRHVLQAALQPDPFFAEEHPDAPALKTGQAFLQICVFDASGLSIDYTMKKVVIS